MSKRTPKSSKAKRRKIARERRSTTIDNSVAAQVKHARRALWLGERAGHVGVLRKAETFDDGRPSRRKDRQATKRALRRAEW